MSSSNNEESNVCVQVHGDLESRMWQDGAIYNMSLDVYACVGCAQPLENGSKNVQK